MCVLRAVLCANVICNLFLKPGTVALHIAAILFYLLLRMLDEERIFTCSHFISGMTQCRHTSVVCEQCKSEVDRRCFRQVQTDLQFV
jgi:hypothetical protein